jgi:hypothetical protein
MKKHIFLLPLLVLISSCDSHKTMIKNNDVEIQSECPEAGSCTIEIIKNKSISLITSELGELYYELNDDENTEVIKYEYVKNVPKGIKDASYREEIIFEIKNSETQLSISDVDLQTTKMIFGRHCFCKGQAGYFKVFQGKLNLIKTETATRINLDCKVNVPQIISSIHVSIK